MLGKDTTGGGVIPAPAPGSANAAAPTQANDFMSKIRQVFPKFDGSPQQTQMIQQLAGSAMQSAQGSGSPLMALLAPMIGTYAVSKAGKRQDEVQADATKSATTAVLGDMANNPQVQGYMSAINDPNVSDEIKSIAQDRLDKILNPPRVGRSGSGSGSGSTAGTRLVGEYKVNGILHGRNNAGQLVPYTDATGQPVKAELSETEQMMRMLAGGGADTTGATPSTPTVTTGNQNDPLGILN